MRSKKLSRSTPRAANVKDRCKQILNWLQDARPCGRSVRLIWVTWTSKDRRECFAETNRCGNELVISLNRPRCRTYSIAIETLLHEYAHCGTWGMAKTESTHFEKSEAQAELDMHDSTYWSEYGCVYNMFHYLDGWRDSKQYEF